MISWIFKGVDFHDPNLTRSPRVWAQYICWCIHFGMAYKWQPRYPAFLRRWIYQHYPYAYERWSITPAMVARWKAINPTWEMTIKHKPLPFWIDVAAQGPFVKPWMRAARFFANHRGGYSHRCEFTDKKTGALYGHKNGAYMNDLFEQFIRNIDTNEVNDPIE